MKTYLTRVIRKKYLVKVRIVENNSCVGYVQETDNLGIVMLTQNGEEKAIRWESVVDITTITD